MRNHPTRLSLVALVCAALVLAAATAARAQQGNALPPGPGEALPSPAGPAEASGAGGPGAKLQPSDYLSPGVPPPALPEGEGLAAKYAADEGIGGDAAVIFAEDFSEASLAEALARWDGVVGDKASVTLAGDSPTGGGAALEMSAGRDGGEGACLVKRIAPGADTVFYRFYVRFSDEHPYVRRLADLGAFADPLAWPPEEVVTRPDGAFFRVEVSPISRWGRYPPPGAWALTSYWWHMRSYEGRGGMAFRGDTFAPEKTQEAGRGRWQCVEVMLEANSRPERVDGEQALWIDGRLVGRWAPATPKGRWVDDEFLIAGYGGLFDGFQWRSREDAKINAVRLGYWMKGAFGGDARLKPPSGAAVDLDHASVRFDNVVIAREYVGPMRLREGEAALDATAAR